MLAINTIRIDGVKRMPDKACHAFVVPAFRAMAGASGVLAATRLAPTANFMSRFLGTLYVHVLS